MKKLLVIGLVLVLGVVAFAGDDEMKQDGAMMDEMPAMSGVPTVWFEIGAKDPAASREFYMKLFDFSLEPMEGMEEYYGFSHMGEDIGGLGISETPYVTVYFAVEDVTKTLNRAVELGGEIAIEETPLGAEGASFGMFKDIEGNFIGVWSGSMASMEDHEMDEMMGEEEE